MLPEQGTLADAALYGQLGMNLSDPSACRWMQSRAPALHAWLLRLHRGDVALLQAGGELRIDAALEPLLAEIGSGRRIGRRCRRRRRLSWLVA